MTEKTVTAQVEKYTPLYHALVVVIAAAYVIEEKDVGDASVQNLWLAIKEFSDACL